MANAGGTGSDGCAPRADSTDGPQQNHIRNSRFGGVGDRGLQELRRWVFVHGDPAGLYPHSLGHLHADCDGQLERRKPTGNAHAHRALENFRTKQRS